MVSKYTFDTYIIYIAKVVDAFITSEFLASDNKKSEQILEKKQFCGEAVREEICRVRTILVLWRKDQSIVSAYARNDGFSGLSEVLRTMSTDLHISTYSPPQNVRYHKLPRSQ